MIEATIPNKSLNHHHQIHQINPDAQLIKITHTGYDSTSSSKITVREAKHLVEQLQACIDEFEEDET